MIEAAYRTEQTPEVNAALGANAIFRSTCLYDSCNFLFLVEWCTRPAFQPEITEETYLPVSFPQQKYDITGLLAGVPYFVRVSTHNMKGFGESCSSDPKSAAPSSEYFMIYLVDAAM